MNALTMIEYRATARLQSERVAMRMARLSLLLLSVGCGRHLPTDPRELEMIVPSEIVELDPRYATRALDVKASRLVHAGLVDLDPDTLMPRPRLAESLELRDERSIVIQLKPNVRFHSGRLLTALDVCATLDALKDPLLESPHRTIVSAFATCLVDGPLRVNLGLSYSRATWMTDLEVPILRADQTRMARNPGTELDGLGPFAVREQTASGLRLVPADDAVLGRPRQSVVIRTVRDENARVLRLLAGQADIAVNAVSPTLLPELRSHPNLTLSSRPGANVTYLLVQNDRDPFRDAALRRALSQAIDRRAIVKQLLNSYAQQAKWLLPESHWATPHGLPPLAYDPVAARRLLTHKGPVTLLTSPDRARVIIARVIAQMLGDAGLETRIVPLDLGMMLARLDAGDFSLAILQIPELTEPNVLSWFFHPQGIPGEKGEGRNRARYRNPRAAELFDAAATSFDRTRRQMLYAELTHLMLEDMPVVPLWHEDQIAVTSTRVVGFRPSAEGHWLSLASTTTRQAN
jgi:peptide/nickel transport system substrate-binding protein